MSCSAWYVCGWCLTFIAGFFCAKNCTALLDTTTSIRNWKCGLYKFDPSRSQRALFHALCSAAVEHICSHTSLIERSLINALGALTRCRDISFPENMTEKRLRQTQINRDVALPAGAREPTAPYRRCGLCAPLASRLLRMRCLRRVLKSRRIRQPFLQLLLRRCR